MRPSRTRSVIPRSKGVAEAAAEYGARPLLWRAAKGSARTDVLLLDTHAWIWMLHAALVHMSAGAWSLIAAAASDRRLFVSDISFWEVSLKAAKGQLRLPTHATLWLGQALRAPGVQGMPLTREVLIQSTLLAGEPHADPADRMLIAQAQLSGMSLLTCDTRIIAYAARVPGIPVCDARP